MLDKLFAKPLSLKIGGQDISFNTLKEFDFALSGRTEVPSKKMAELLVLSPDDLKREAKSIKAVEKQFVEILSNSIESQTSIAEYLKKIDSKVFSQDHNWREIMSSLQQKDDDYDELRRLALVKYMQYLTARQEVIKHTYSVKKMAMKAASAEAPAEEVDEAPEDRLAETKDSLRDSKAPAVASPAALRETVILDTKVIQLEPKQKESFTRMPKGEAFKISLSKGEKMDILLSKHPYRVVHENNGIFFTDDSGTRHELQSGKNIIGRDTVCNVVVNAAFRDISRLHVIIERLTENDFRVTDLSSHGTFLPSQHLEHSLA